VSAYTDEVTRAISELSLLPRFPSVDMDIRIAMVRFLNEMVRNAGRQPGDSPEEVARKDTEALAWLVKRALNLWSRWEGLRELRAIYCSRYAPGDGIEATSAIYTDGVPPDPALPVALLPAPKAEAWPKEELEAIGRAWAARNQKSPAQQRRDRMRAWLRDTWRDVIALDPVYDDALLGLATLASNRLVAYAVYDEEALVDCLIDREELSPEMALESVARLDSDVLLFYRPPGERARPTVYTMPVTQQEIDQALVVARAQRAGWTPERLAELEAEAGRRKEGRDA
jgi:hypothetical protein